MWEAKDIHWLCQGMLKARYSVEEIYNRLFAPEKPLAGALNLSQIEKIRKDEAKMVAYGMVFSGRSPEKVFEEIFAPDPTNPLSPWPNALSLEEIREVFEWSPTGREAIKQELLERTAHPPT